MSRYTPTTAGSGYLTITNVNTNYTDIQTAVNDMLSRKSGDDPNTMEVNLDMNSNKILNLASPVNGSDAARFSDITDALDVSAIGAPAISGNAGSALVVNPGETATIWKTPNDLVSSATAVSITGSFNIDNMSLNGNTLLATDTNGNLTVSPDGTGLGKVIRAQVSFPATAVASADVNTLDDYEEGTFTPTFETVNADISATHDQQAGTYTKIGDTVYFTIQLGTDAVTPGTGNLIVDGLPFAHASDGTEAAVTIGAAYAFTTVPLGAVMFPGEDNIRLFATSNSSTGSTSADLNTGVNGNRFRIAGFYKV